MAKIAVIVGSVREERHGIKVEVFDESGNLVDTNYDRRLTRFLNEFDWYIEAMQKQRKIGTLPTKLVC